MEINYSDCLTASLISVLQVIYEILNTRRNVSQQNLKTYRTWMTSRNSQQAL